LVLKFNDRKLASLARFNTIYWQVGRGLLFRDHPRCMRRSSRCPCRIITRYSTSRWTSVQTRRRHRRRRTRTQADCGRRGKTTRRHGHDGWQHKGTMSRKPVFEKIAQRRKGRMSRYVDIYRLCSRHRHLLWLLLTQSRWFQWCKQNTNFRPVTGNKYSTLFCHKVNDGWGIKSAAGLKTFVHWLDVNNAFVDPVKFDELLQ